MSLSRKAVLSLAATLTLLAATPSRAAIISHAANPSTTQDDLRAHIIRLQALASSCSASAQACDVQQIGSDETFGDPTQPGGYTVSWGWLRDTFETAAKAEPGARKGFMRMAQTRLASLLADLNTSALSTPVLNNPAAATDFPAAHAAVQKTLNTNEFHADDNITFWDRFKAKLWSWIARAFEGLDDVASHRPWLGKALAALFFLAAAVGLLLFVRRQLADSRLRVQLNDHANPVSGWARESTAWADLATQRAAEGDFREAVHCLYWAAIILLEGRRAWRHDPSRTPREYVRLLPAGSPQREHLRALTTTFERLWYGLRDATEPDYLAAREHFLALEANRATTLGAPGPDPRTRDAAPIAGGTA